MALGRLPAWVTSRSSRFSSWRLFSSTRPTTENEQLFRYALHVFQRGISHLRFDHPELGRWRRVLDFSARNVGPKQYVLPNAIAVASL